MLFLLIWLVIATHIYAYAWSTHLDFFPELPESVGRWIADLTGTAETDDIEMLTLYYILIVSFVVVTSATLLGLAVCAMLKNSGVWVVLKHRFVAWVKGT